MCRAATAVSALAIAAAVGLVTAGPAAAVPYRGERVAQASGTAQEAVEHARGKIGTPYRYGGGGPSSFDCSGLVQWSYRQAGVRLQRTTYSQVKQGSAVSRSNLRPGDLVFFYSGASHVGMYVGDGRMIHAPSSGKRVQVVTMSAYYDRHFHSARRVA